MTQMLDVNKSSAGMTFSERTTAGSGRFFSNSDRTLVSSK
jgi:hypothetical protein